MVYALLQYNLNHVLGLRFSQVAALKAACNYPRDDSLLEADSWGLKKLFTYGCAKAGFGSDKSPARRDSWLS